MARQRKNEPPANPQQAAHITEMLEELREKRGVSAAELAELVGTKANSFSQWKNGRRKMQLGTAKSIEAAVREKYGLTFRSEWILGFDVPKNSVELVERRRAGDAAAFSGLFFLAEAAGVGISVGDNTPQNLDEALDGLSGIECEYLRTSNDGGKTFRYIPEAEGAGRVFLTDGERSAILDLDDFTELERQITAYVKVRLDLLLQRGKW